MFAGVDLKYIIESKEEFNCLRMISIKREFTLYTFVDTFCLKKLKRTNICVVIILSLLTQ